MALPHPASPDLAFSLLLNAVLCQSMTPLQIAMPSPRFAQTTKLLLAISLLYLTGLHGTTAMLC